MSCIFSGTKTPCTFIATLQHYSLTEVPNAANKWLWPCKWQEILNCHLFTVCVCCTHVGLPLIPMSIHFMFWYGRYNLKCSALKMPSLDSKISELFHGLKVGEASAAVVTFPELFPLSSWYSWGKVPVGNITSWFLPLWYRKSPVFKWSCCIFLCLWPILNVKGWGYLIKKKKPLDLYFYMKSHYWAFCQH